MTKTAAPDGQKSYIFYDEYLHSTPLCVVTVSADAVGDLDSQSQERLCDVGQDKGKKIAQKLFFENRENTLKQLPKYSEDANGARTSYKFDEYARVTEVYSPKLDKPNESLNFPSQQAFYYDSTTPMRTRTQVKTLLPDNSEVIMVSDSFMDGFGNPYQTVNYNNIDKDGEYALVSYQTFNGIGQVTSKVTNIPVRDLKSEGSPKLVEISVLGERRGLANIEQTTYDYFSRPVEVKITAGGEGASVSPKVTRTSYNGYEVNAFDVVNNQVKRVMDGLGREVKTVNYLCETSDSNCTQNNGKPIETNTTYDILGNPLEIKDSNGIALKTVLYNTVSMPLQITDVDRGISKMYYDDYGRAQKTVDAKGTRAETQYDGFGRVLVNSVFSGNNAVRITTNEYDTDKIGALYKTTLNGMLPVHGTKLVQEVTTTSNYAGAPLESTTTTLDVSAYEKGQLTYITKVDNNAYSQTGLLINTTSRLKDTNEILDDISYSYHKDLELKALTDNTIKKPILNNIISDYKGQILSYTLGLGDNPLTTTNAYDNLSRLTEKKTILSKTSDLLDNLIYAYNDASNIRQTVQTDDPSTKSTITKSYTYDSFSRLKSVAGATSEEFKISDVGALTYKKEGSDLVESKFASDLIDSGISNPCSDALYTRLTGYKESENSCPYHALLLSTKNDKATAYLYDKNGNLIKEKNNDLTYKVYTYGVLDLPVKIEEFDGNKKSINLTKFMYGLGGQRIGKIGQTNAPDPNPTIDACPNFALGDANCDGLITNSDFDIWRSEFTTRGNEGATKISDFNQNGIVDNPDYEIWRQSRFPNN